MTIAQDVLDAVFADASEMAGAEAPWQIDPQRIFIRKIRTAVRTALKTCPKKDYKSFEKKLKRAVKEHDLDIRLAIAGYKERY